MRAPGVDDVDRSVIPTTKKGSEGGAMGPRCDEAGTI